MATQILPVPSFEETHYNPSSKSLVIVVPGVGTPPANTWFQGKGQRWPQLLPEDVLPSPSVYLFNHNLLLDTNPRLWSDVIEKGLELLEALMTLFNAKEELRNIPIVFIAHSLGGCMVKQCITHLLERKSDFQDIAQSLAIFIAIATPHSLSEDPRDWCLPQHLIATRGFYKKGSPASVDDARNLSSLCLRFRGVAWNLRILTLCETKELMVKRLWSKSYKAQLIPEDLCRVRTDFEDFIRVDATHVSIAKETPSDVLEKPVRVAVETTLKRIETEQNYDPKLFPLEESNVAYYNDAGNVFTATPDADDGAISSSRQVTFPQSDPRKDSQSLTDFSFTKRDPLLPCYVLPHGKNKHFHDRTGVLSTIEQFLGPVDEEGLPRRELKTFALCGPGGMGKTQIANEYAETHRDAYEAILWVHAEEKSTLDDEFSRLAEHLGLVLEGSADAMDPVLTRELVKGWMEKPVRSYNRADNGSLEEVPWLLVFDNVRDMEILGDVWPSQSTYGSILVTSRDHLAKSPFYEISNGMDVPPMTDGDASGLLLKMTWREDSLEEQQLSLEVADKLGGLPLALTQMAGVMVRQHLSFSKFLRRYEEEEKRNTLFGLSYEGKSRSKYGHTLASVWALEELRDSSGLLGVLAFLNPDQIPEKYLEKATGDVVLADFPKDTTGYQDARAELLKSSLIMSDGSSSDSSTISIHRLIQDAARAKMSQDRMSDVFSAVVDVLWLAWPEAERGVRHHIGRWKECESVSPHIMRVRDHYLNASKTLQSIWKTNLTFALLLNELGWYFQERGRTTDALACYQIAETNVNEIISRQQSKGSGLLSSGDIQRCHYLLAEIHNNTAGSATELNDPDTALHHFKIYNRLLRDQQDSDGDNRDSRLTSSFFNLGMSHIMKGDYESAVKSMGQALGEAERLEDPKKVKAARSLGLINLALTYWLMERHDEAAQTLETALRERVELLGPNDRQSMITGRVLHGLGNVRRSQGLLDESLHFHELALLHFKETVGNNHHRTGNSCFKVAEHYSRTGKLKEASDLLDQAIKIFDRHNCYAPEKGRAVLLKSTIFEQQRNSARSDDCVEEACTLHSGITKASIGKTEITLDHFNKYVHVWGR